jgi:alanyl-tRNA synthetase
MLGNFSFQDYFKKEACLFGYELLTQGFGFDAERLWVTVFKGNDAVPADEEAAEIWEKVVGVPRERIVRLGAKDNFWAMGDTGPCGPCSEIHFDRGEAFGPADMENSERFFELWNLVFMQFNVSELGGPMTPLAKPCIDTGAGLERIASVIQGVSTNYDIDVFLPLLEATAALAGKQYGANAADDVSMRVIADHARMTAFLIAEGIFPEKSGREYVLRRVMRRAIRHGHRLGIGDLFVHEVALKVVELMHEAYTELADKRAVIEQIAKQEEERFRSTLERGLEILTSTDTWVQGPDEQRMLPGEVAFDLTATYGFPRDLIEIIGEEEGFVLDAKGYAAAEDHHRALSGAGRIGDAAVAPVYASLRDNLGQTDFVGYSQTEIRARVTAIVRDRESVDAAEAGEAVEVVLDRTPFYGEAGGQVGDMGTIAKEGGAFQVKDVVRPLPGLFAHQGVIETGRLAVGDEVFAKVDDERRQHIRRHHTATHLLHMALRRVLGEHATQKGSRVDAERLRFDFSHFEPLTGEQLVEIERIAAHKIFENVPVETVETTYDDARKRGAMALFGERYEENVRMISVSSDSVELCGGTHVARSGDIGACFIVGETGIAAGVRRIEAVAGVRAMEWFQANRRLLDETATLLKVSPDKSKERVASLISREKALTREVDALKRELASGGQDLMTGVREIGDVKVLGAKVAVGEPGALRDTADLLRDRLGSGVVCLGGDNGGKAALVVAVTKDLTDKLRAGELVKEISKSVGGRGGGRPDFAQAGGPDVAGLDDAVSRIYEVVKSALKA